jgi:hypothetical protein
MGNIHREAWEKILDPETLKSNIINASIFSMAFEMLKKSITDKIEAFFSDGFDQNRMIISEEYKEEVLSLNKSPLYASLAWLQNMEVISADDFEQFEYIKRCRNTLVHETLSFVSTGVDFDLTEVFDEMRYLLRKIEMWWFVNFEMAIDPEAYPKDLDLDEVIPGPIWSLNMLIDVALGSEEEAAKYYEQFIERRDKKYGGQS